MYLRPKNPNLDPNSLLKIVNFVKNGADDAEFRSKMSTLGLSHSSIMQIITALSERNLSALQFFETFLRCFPEFRPSSETYNCIIDNLGCVGDWESMYRVLSELSTKGHSVTERAFLFVNSRVSVGKVVEVLNRVGRSCRATGIFSLIKLLCSLGEYELAVWVMEETVRKTSYYNVLIAAKCRTGDFGGVENVLDEMRRSGCDPNTKSYNYLLASLFKTRRVAEACELLQKMEDLGYFPDRSTYEVITVHACKANRMDFAMDVVNEMVEVGLEPTLAMHGAFVRGYFLSGRTEDAHKYIVSMSMIDQCSVNMNYSLLASLYRKSGRFVEAGRVLYEMMGKGLKPIFPVYIKVAKDLHNTSKGDMASELIFLFKQFN